MDSIGVDSVQLWSDTQAAGLADTSTDHSISIRQRFERILTFLEALADGFTVAAAVVGAFYIYHWLHIGRRLDYSFRFIWFIAFAMSATYVILLDRDGAYRPGASLLRIKETERALRVSLQAFFLALPVTFFTQFQFSRWVSIIALMVVPVLLVTEKQVLLLVARALRARGVGVRRVLIYGAGFSGRRVYSALVRSPKLGLNPVVLVDDDLTLAGQEVFEDAYRRERSVPVISEPITEDLLKRYQCEFLIIAIPTLDKEKFSSVVRAARKAKARLAYIPAQTIDIEYWTEQANIDGLMLNLVGQPSNDWYYDTAKRASDLLVSLVLIIALAPIWFLISILIRLDSPGPVLFSQKRVGRKGRLFNLFKFRTMYVDAPKYAFSPKETLDPRITRIGRFLRRTSLDEFPQLLNVLKGDMSLVGPRPEMPFIVESYTFLQRQRLQVMPGITGLWQLSADRASLIHENIQYDLYYIRHRNFFMDVAILFHTILFATRGV